MSTDMDAYLVDDTAASSDDDMAAYLAAAYGQGYATTGGLDIDEAPDAGPVPEQFQHSYRSTTAMSLQKTETTVRIAIVCRVPGENKQVSLSPALQLGPDRVCNSRDSNLSSIRQAKFLAM